MTTAILAGFPCLVQLGAMASRLAGGVGFAAVAPTALIVALFGGAWLARREGLAGARRWQPLALVVGLLAATLALSAFYYDLSWDGEWYHQTGILAIARGWNPLTDPMRGFVEHLELWVRHYAKGTWYFAAALYETTGRIELGKCLNWFAPAATFLAVLAAGLDGGLRRGRAIGIAAVVTLNPVVTSEVTTFLVDGVMISFLVIAVAAMFGALRRPSFVVVVAGVAASIASINAKFTGLVFLCFALAAAALWYAARRRELLPRLIGFAAFALALGVGLWGANPYLTNTLHRHQPFYPVLGSAAFPSLTQQGKEGIELYETPANMMGRHRLVRFAYAIFGRPNNAPYTADPNAKLMLPFTARPADLKWYRYHETRVAGFGPFFSGALLLGFALGVWLLLAAAPGRGLLVLLAATIVASLLISLHLWWPRYGPQLWLLPIAPVLFAFAADRSRLQLRFAWALLALLLINAAVVATVRLHWETTASRALHRQLRELAQSGQLYEFDFGYFGESAKARLATAGVRFRACGPESFKEGRELISVVEGYPGAIRYRPVDGVATDPDRR